MKTEQDIERERVREREEKSQTFRQPPSLYFFLSQPFCQPFCPIASSRCSALPSVSLLPPTTRPSPLNESRKRGEVRATT